MYRLKWEGEQVYVVGCGGTGGFVAEGLCRLLPKKLDIMLQDPDTVEERNLTRQNFFAGDLGKFKSQALAERLCGFYGRRIGYAVTPYRLTSNNGALVIGCVDNADARRQLGRSGFGNNGRFSGWWIDAGNGEHSGQVLIGNSNSAYFEGETAWALPLPSIQQPALLVATVKKVRRSCAEAVEADEQSRVINQAMASLVLQFVYRLISGELAWMGAYLDLEAMTLSAVQAEPKTCARLLKVKESTLIGRKR